MTFSNDETQPPPELGQALESLSALTEALSRSRVTTALVRADGVWHVDHDDRLQTQSSPLSAEVSKTVVQAVHRHGACCCLHRWWVQPLNSHPVRTVAFKRRPCAEPDGVSDHTLQLLKPRLEHRSSGLVFGHSRRARSALMLSLLQLFRVDFAAYIGAVPPVEPDGVELLHLEVPADDRERSQLVSVVESAPVVVFDGVGSASDLRLLFAGRQPAGRWMTVDASYPETSHWSTQLWDGREVPVNTRIGVRGEVANSIRLQHFSVRRPGGWEVLLDEGQSPGDEAHPEETTTIEQSSADTAAVTRTIDHNAGLGDDSSTTSPETPTRIRQASDPDGVGDNIEVHAESAAGSDSDAESLRESGEIAVPGFGADSDPAPVDETAEDEPPAGLRGRRIDDELPELVASGDVDDVEIPELEPGQLRQTFENDIDPDELRQVREEQRRQAGAVPEAIETSEREPPTDEFIRSDSEPETTEMELEHHQQTTPVPAADSNEGADEPSTPNDVTENMSVGDILEQLSEASEADSS